MQHVFAPIKAYIVTVSVKLLIYADCIVIVIQHWQLLAHAPRGECMHASLKI